MGVLMWRNNPKAMVILRRFQKKGKPLSFVISEWFASTEIKFNCEKQD